MPHQITSSELKVLSTLYSSNLHTYFSTCNLLQLPNYIISQVFCNRERTHRVKTDMICLECTLCHEGFKDIIELTLHVLLKHPNYDLHGVLQIESKNNCTLIYNYMAKNPAFVKTSHLVVLDHNKLTESMTQQDQCIDRIKILLNSVFIDDNLIDGHKLIVYYRQRDTDFEPADFQYWIDKHRLKDREELSMNNHSKMNHLTLHSKEREFFMLWSIFVQTIKEELLESNYPLTSILNTDIETYVLTYIFVERYVQKLKELYPELIVHIITLYLNKLIDEKQLYNIKRHIRSNCSI